MQSAVELLTKAQDLIRDPKHWTQHHLAKRSLRSAYSIPPLSVEATCWCVIGALVVSEEGGHFEEGRFARSFAHSSAYALAMQKLIAAANTLYGDGRSELWKLSPVASVNDFGSRRVCHKRVMAMYDLARELVKEEGV